MTTTEAMSPVEVNDAELVAHSLRGDRDAFGQIVARYQALICSLAYSFTGRLAQSEDLAQETFVTAWKQLSGLREPAKLRPWLCGIVRNLSHRTLRGQKHEPVHEAEPLEALDKLPAPGPHPLEQAISREEEGILWRSLGRIPETYREPLILFYREHESVEQVALALELSEDTVRQRLVRGRKLLHEEILAFVEGALGKTSPGPAFTQGVLAALPMVATSAKATAVSVTLATGGAVAKGAVTTLGSLGGWFAMLGGGFVTARAEADNAKSLRERKFMFPMVGLQLTAVLLYSAAMWAVGRFAFPHAPFCRDISRAIIMFLLCVFVVGLAVYRSRRQHQIQIEEKTFDENEWKRPDRRTDSAADSPETKPNSNLKTVKLMAFPLVMAALGVFRAPWKHHLGAALVVLAIQVLLLFFIWRLVRNRPRFLAWSGRGFVLLVCMPIILGLLTLVAFNFEQYLARTNPNLSNAPSPAEVTAFNLVVVLAYALFVGILIWKRDHLKLRK